MRRAKGQPPEKNAVAVVGDSAALLPLADVDDATLSQTLSRLAREQIVIEPQGRWRQPELPRSGACQSLSMLPAVAGTRVAVDVAALRRDLRAEWQRKTGRPAR
jgi:hypothetical protein